MGNRYGTYVLPPSDIQEEPDEETWGLDMEEYWENELEEKYSSEKDFPAPLNATQEEPNGKPLNFDSEEKQEKEFPESLQGEKSWDPSPSMQRDPKNSEKRDPETPEEWNPKPQEDWEPKAEEEMNIITQEGGEPKSESDIQEEPGKETWGLHMEEIWEKELAEKYGSEKDFPAPLNATQEEPNGKPLNSDSEEKQEKELPESLQGEKSRDPSPSMQRDPKNSEKRDPETPEEWNPKPQEDWEPKAEEEINIITQEGGEPKSESDIQEEPGKETWGLHMEEIWEKELAEKYGSEKDFPAPLNATQEEPNGKPLNSDSEEKQEKELPESLQGEKSRDPSPSMQRDPKNSEKRDPETPEEWNPKPQEDWEPKAEEEMNIITQEGGEPKSESDIQEEPGKETWGLHMEEILVKELAEKYGSEKDFPAPLNATQEEPNGKPLNSDSEEKWEKELPESLQGEKSWDPSPSMQRDPKNSEKRDPETPEEWNPKPQEDWEPKAEQEMNIITQEGGEPKSENPSGDRLENEAEDIQPYAHCMEGAPATPKKGGKFRALKRGFGKLLRSFVSKWFCCANKTRTESCSSGINDFQYTLMKPSSNAALYPDSFTFHSTLGEGGFGKVMLASHPSFDQQLAVKISKKRQLIEEDPNSALIERKVLEMVRDCQFLTHAFATFQTENHIFFVMEYLSGGDLSLLIEDKAPLNVATVRFLTAEILCGLQHLHSRGIVHRDMKSDNILLDSAGHAKIADFGMAVIDMFGSRTIDECCGTITYMAPEVHLSKPYNNTADYFSFGVIVYEMAVGVLPFYDGEDDDEVCRSMCSDNPHYPMYVNPEVQDFIERLLQKTPQRRQELIENLRDHPVFSSIDWVELEARKIHPPFALKPSPVIDPHDNISVSGLMMDSEAEEPPISAEDQMRFAGFSFRSERWN